MKPLLWAHSDFIDYKLFCPGRRDIQEMRLNCMHYLISWAAFPNISINVSAFDKTQIHDLLSMSQVNQNTKELLQYNLFDNMF